MKNILAFAVIFACNSFSFASILPVIFEGSASMTRYCSKPHSGLTSYKIGYDNKTIYFQTLTGWGPSAPWSKPILAKQELSAQEFGQYIDRQSPANKAWLGSILGLPANPVYTGTTIIIYNESVTKNGGVFIIGFKNSDGSDNSTVLMEFVDKKNENPDGFIFGLQRGYCGI